MDNPEVLSSIAADQLKKTLQAGCKEDGSMKQVEQHFFSLPQGMCAWVCVCERDVRYATKKQLNSNCSIILRSAERVHAVSSE